MVVNPEQLSSDNTDTQRKQAVDALRRSEEALRQSHEQLEQRVIDRTAELAHMNRMLREQIAERTGADAKLQENEMRFREMAENVNAVVWVRDTESDKILYISPVYESIWGRSCQSMYDSASSFLEAVLPEDLPVVATYSYRLRTARLRFRCSTVSAWASGSKRLRPFEFAKTACGSTFH